MHVILIVVEPESTTSMSPERECWIESSRAEFNTFMTNSACERDRARSSQSRVEVDCLTFNHRISNRRDRSRHNSNVSETSRPEQNTNISLQINFEREPVDSLMIFSACQQDKLTRAEHTYLADDSFRLRDV